MVSAEVLRCRSEGRAPMAKRGTNILRRCERPSGRREENEQGRRWRRTKKQV